MAFFRYWSVIVAFFWGCFTAQAANVTNFKERANAISAMIDHNVDKVTQDKSLSADEKHLMLVREYMILVFQMQYYITAFGIHDTPTTVKEIKKFRRVVERHVDQELTEMMTP